MTFLDSIPSIKEIAKDAALATAYSEIARNGFPISSSSRPHQSQTQEQAAKDAMRRLLRDRLIKFAEAKKRHDSLPALARELLSDGEVIAATAEGVVVELPHEIFAHVGRDGTVDMMAPQCGQGRNFANDIQELVQRIGEERLTRNSVLDVGRADHVDIQSHVPEVTASSSSSNAGKPEERFAGCGTGNYSAGSSNEMPPQCGTSNVDMRPEPYLGAGNPIIERLDEALEARRKAEAEILKRLRPGVDPKKLAQCRVPRRRSLSDSDLRPRGPIGNIVRAFDAQGGSQAGSSSQPPLSLEGDRVIDNGQYGKIVIGADGSIRVVPPESGTIGEYRNPVDVFNECERGNITNGPSKIFEKKGGFEDGLRDCLSMGATDIRKIPKGVVGTLPDGRSINVRVSSSDGPDGSWPTLEIQESNSKRKMKIRYRD